MNKRKVLNVRSVLERIIRLNTQLASTDMLPSIYKNELCDIAFLSKALLLKRDKSATRKDLYVNTKK